MSSRERKSVGVELVALGASGVSARWSARVERAAQGSRIRVGSGRDADIVLPSDRFPRVGRLHCAIVFVREGTFLELYQADPVATVDGFPADNAVLGAKAHELSIGDYRFRLTITH
jgi:hypothetical protein